MGYDSAVVTGCPSLFQMGRDYTVLKSVNNECINPAFNGDLQYLSKLVNAFPNSNYYDQDLFIEQLYKPNYIDSFGFKRLLSFYCNCGPEVAGLLANDRVKLFPEMCDWRNALINEKHDFSFGSRIHGNIMAILSGIPATVVAIDSRTREMAEFFNIPCILPTNKRPFTVEEFQEVYSEADYTDFNDSFSQKYDAYEKFIVDNGIATKLNPYNRFFKNEKGYEPLTAVNQDDFIRFSKKLKIFELPLKLMKKVL